MGFFDVRCAVTGLSLRGEDAAVVLVVEREDTYRPCSLLLVGNYNRLGAVDGVKRGPNSRAITSALQRWHAEGRIEGNLTGTLDKRVSPDAVLECLAENQGTLRLDGLAIGLTLIGKRFVDAICKSGVPLVERRVLAAALPERLAREIYGSDDEVLATPKLAAEFARFAVLREYVDAHHGWKPDFEPQQTTPESELEQVPTARARCANHAPLLRAIGEYERERESELDEP